MERITVLKPMPKAIRTAAAVAAIGITLTLVKAMSGLANHYMQATGHQDQLHADASIAAARANAAHCKPDRASSG